MNESTNAPTGELKSLIERMQRIEGTGDVSLMSATLAANPELVRLIDLFKKRSKTKSGLLYRSLPAPAVMSALQVSIHDNWSQDTKPKGRKPKTGNASREHATRYAVTVQAWDCPAEAIELSARDFGYQLSGDLYDATAFAKRALDLQNIVLKDGVYTVNPNRRKAVRNTISDEVRELMLGLTKAAPDHLFALLKAKDGTAPGEQLLSISLDHRGGKLVAVDAVIWLHDDVLPIRDFGMCLAGGKPFDPGSNVVLQARCVTEPNQCLEKWTSGKAPA